MQFNDILNSELRVPPISLDHIPEFLICKYFFLLKDKLNVVEREQEVQENR